MNQLFSWRLPSIVALLLLVAAMGLLGGPSQPADHLLLGWTGYRGASGVAATIAQALTQLGNGLVLIPVGMVIMAFGWRRLGHQAALAAAATLIIVRLAVEGMKAAVHRPRPALDVHPALTHGFAFPSAHAANSLATGLVAALLLAPPERRPRWLAAGAAFGLLIGTTRPYLGVHWPSDVIGGWALALALVIAATPWINPKASPAFEA